MGQLAGKLADELRELFETLKGKTFSGEGIGRYYPQGSTDAHYRMSYSPARFELRHKSPWTAPEEVFTVNYNNVKDLNFASFALGITGEEPKVYTQDDLDALDVEKSLGYMIKYLFKDPRYVLAATESIQEISTEEDRERCYQVVALDLSSMDGPKIMAELLVDEGVLRRMKIRNFLFGKEIKSQNMEIIFTF